MILEKLRKKHVKKTLEKISSSITESSHHVTIMHITLNSKYDIKNTQFLFDNYGYYRFPVLF